MLRSRGRESGLVPAATTEFLRGTVEAMVSEVAVVDAQGDILLVNRAWRGFGEDNGLTTPDACLGANYLAACDVAGEDGRYALAALHGIRDVLAGRRPTVAFEYPCHAPDAKRWFMMRVGAFALEGARYAVIMHEDITARHVSEEITRAHEEELAAFNASLSHDPRGPLRRIEEAADELRAEDQRLAETIRAQTQRARDLVAAMIDMSRVSSARLDLQDVDLSRLAAAVATDIEQTLPLHGVRWRIHPDLRASGDPSLLRFVLENLLHNAWKYTRDAPSASVEFGRGVDPEGRAAFFVRDNGVGFPQETAAALFRSFQRVANESALEGTGLGLATVARIIERHGGEVWATGAPGKGATFWFTLPASPATPRA